MKKIFIVTVLMMPIVVFAADVVQKEKAVSAQKQKQEKQEKQKQEKQKPQGSPVKIDANYCRTHTC